ncbi:MAG: hypothetical protein A2Y33_07095 [Spirochaetes bacterium GWF1_51_8]|nr:MAG: hypothetical protein A2Y33_07095 [Spirochaetes bacterium GWF1_51_8]
MKRNWFSIVAGVVMMGVLASCGAVNIDKAIAENKALLEKCIVAAKDAKVKMESAAAAADVATILNNVTDEIKGYISQGKDISVKYGLNQDQEDKILDALGDKVEEFSNAGRELGETVGAAMVKFQDDAAGLELINGAVENFKTIGE